MSLNNWDFGYNFTAQNAVTPTLNTINQGMDQLGQNSQEEAAKVAKSFFEMETAAKVAAKGMAAIDAMKSMKTDFADFEAGMAEASTLLKGASVDMSAYEASLLEMSATYGELPAELTKSLYTAISSGFTSASDSSALLKKSMELSVGGVTTAAEAMDGLTTIMHAWGFEVKDLDRIGDTLFVGMREGKTTIGEQAREIGQIASFSKQAGQSLEEMVAANAALTLGGRTTSEAMNGLRSILAEVMRQEPGVMKTVEALEKASGMKLDFNVAGLEKKGIGKFLIDIRKAVDAAGSETGIARLFGRIQGMSSVLSLTGPQAEKFASIMEKMRNKSGDTQDAVNKMMATSRMETKRYEASVKIMRIETGRALQPILSIIRRVKQAFVDFFTTVARRAPWLIQLVGIFILVGATIAIVIAKIIALKATFLLLSVFAKGIITALVGGFAALAPVILPIAAAIAGIVAVLYTLKRAYEENWGGFAFGVDLVTQSIGHLFSALKQLALTGEITGATAEFLVMHETLYSIVQALWYLGVAAAWAIGGIIEGFTAVGDIMEPVKGQFEAVADMWERIGAIFSDVFGDVGLVSDSAITPMKVLGAVGYGVGMAVAFALRAIVAALGLVVAAFGAALGVIAAAFMGLWRIVKGFIRILTGDWKNGLAEMILAVAQFVASILTIVWGLVDSIVFAFLSMFGVTRDEWNRFLVDFGAFFMAFGQYLLAIVNAVLFGFKWVFEALATVFFAIVGAMRATWEGFVWFMGLIWENTIGALIGNLGFLGVAFEAVANFLKRVWDPIFTWFEDKLGWIKDMADGLFDIADKIGGAISDAGGAIADVGGKIGSGVSDLGAKIFGGKAMVAEGFSMPQWRPATASPVGGPAGVGGAVVPTAATTGGRGGAGPGAGGKAPLITVVQPPGKATIVVDGRVLAEAVMTHTDAKREATMAPVVPVWSGFGGR
ncbi:MAG: phage tail tape measure protein [Desulfobacterales bacterium]|nr:phage tail tape measure protein [Desulfobacterales bacterium]